MAAPQSTPLPPAGQRNEAEAEYISKQNAFVAAQEPFRVELQAQADFNDTAATNAGASETASKASEDAAKVSENIALSAGNYVGVWASLTGSVLKGVSVAHDGKYWGSLVDIANITAEEPGVSADWQVAGYSASEFGLGTIQAPLISDGDAITLRGWNKVNTTWTGSPYAGSNAKNQGTIFNDPWTALYVRQTFYGINAGDSTLFRKLVDGVWGDWDEVFSSANINIFKFESSLCFGRATNRVRVLITVPYDPVSITVTGTISILSMDGAVVDTFTSGDCVLATTSRQGCANIDITGLTGIVNNQAYFFLATSGEGILVNK
jgi:hypothetical protein